MPRLTIFWFEFFLMKRKLDGFFEEHQIKVTKSDEPFKVDPILEFKEAGFPKRIVKALKVFTNPTPIQSVAWPLLQQSLDIIGISATGSGKTLAFGIPGLISIKANLIGKPQILVLSPTRELAIQIQEQFEQFGTPFGITSVCIYGGVPKREQQQKLKSGANCIIATPGRLIDLINENYVCDLSGIQYLVLDEADRMLDQGFEEAIKTIISHVPKKRQTVMFSATWPLSIQKMAMTYLKSPVRITVGSTDLSANNRIEQRVEVIDPLRKESRLLELLKDYHKSKTNRVLIFALYKKEAARLEQIIKRNGYNAGAIHGDLSQQQRSDALQGFKSGTAA